MECTEDEYFLFLFFKITVLLLLGRPMLEVETTGGVHMYVGFCNYVAVVLGQ
jgi:hypothetical protein